MAEKQELQVQQKREVDKAQESTTPTRAFVPSADIYESENALTVVLEMPGVSPDAVNIMLDQRVLMISGRSRSSAPEGYSLTHQEYRDGDYERAAELFEEGLVLHREARNTRGVAWSVCSLAAVSSDGRVTSSYARRAASSGLANASAGKALSSAVIVA